MCNSKISQAYAKCQPARDALHEMDAVCMERTEDKAGIVWERWYVQTSLPTEVQQRVVNVIVFATPTWWDVFTPISDSGEIAATIAAIKALCHQRAA